MWKTRLVAVLLLVAGIGIGYFVYASEPALHGNNTVPGSVAFVRFPFKLGLDLSGGSHLVYRADLASTTPSERQDSMDALRDVIERRVNLFGVAEPLVQIENGATPEEGRLIVELPGVTDVNRAIAMIGATPVLEFRTERTDGKTQAILDAIAKAQQAAQQGKPVLDDPLLKEDPYEQTQLTGRFLDKATLEFNSTTHQPIISLAFNNEGAQLFAKLTKENIGKVLAIYLDGAPISTPVVREEITGGKAQITGVFTPDEAKQLVGRLNSGALPVGKMELLSTQSIGASLGGEAAAAGVKAGIYGLAIVAIFLVLWYRLPGILAVIALGIYVVMMLALFKLIPVTLTAAGIAGFILSIGMAVDANILIFARMKEELAAGKTVNDAMHEGFRRAWLSIRDSNISSMITAIILFWFGTSLIEGFALTFGIGVLVSMFTAITITRTFLFSLGVRKNEGVAKFLFGSGILNSFLASRAPKASEATRS
jgi:preprotein translocase subunit SecD